MFFLLLPLLFICSLANAGLVTVECSDGKAQFELTDLLESKCLRITQAESNISLNGIDSRSLKLFIKLSKLNDDKIFAFIDSLNPDEFGVIDHYAKYLRCYHEFDALFKYKFLKEYSLVGSRKEMFDFVDNKFFQFKFIYDAQDGISQWKQTTLFDIYCSKILGFSNQEILAVPDYRAFFVLIDFYQQVMKKPLKLSTQHLKNIFCSFDPSIQRELLKKQLVIVPK
jgi:hypothetical protein